MECPLCQLRWTAPPTTCPKCRHAHQEPSAPSSDPLPSASPSSFEDVESSAMVMPASKWGYAEELPYPPTEERPYSRLQSSPKNSAVYSIVFGIIGIVSGVISLSHNPINIILVLLGVFLCIEGFWLLSAKPSPTTYLVDGIALLLLGLWNVFVTIANLSAGGGMGVFLIFGILQLVWAFQRFREMDRIK